LRKIVSIFLLFLFLGNSVGLSAKVHFCNDKLSSVNLFSVEETPTCCCPDVLQDEGCCSDAEVIVKQDDSDKISNRLDFKNTFETFYVSSTNHFQNQSTKRCGTRFYINQDPHLKEISPFALLCTFRI